MIPTPISPGVRGDEPTRIAGPCGAAPVLGGRFADCLASEGDVPRAAAPTPDTGEPVGAPGVPTAHARLFNQDGFFGHPDAGTPPPAAPAPPPVAIADRSIPTADGGTADAVPLRASPASLPSARRPHGASSPDHGRPVRAAGTSAPDAAVSRGSPAHIPAVRSPAAVATPDRAASARSSRPRPSPAPAATVAVAIHAAARGIEVAAQLAGLDERDRAALADEIAALLSAHGYAPAQVSVTAVLPRAARQEHR